MAGFVGRVFKLSEDYKSWLYTVSKHLSNPSRAWLYLVYKVPFHADTQRSFLTPNRSKVTFDIHQFLLYDLF